MAHIRRMLLGGASLLICSAAHAQTGAETSLRAPNAAAGSSASQNAGDVQNAATAPADAAKDADIVVTGSRVANGNNAPTPVTILSVQQLQASHPATVFESLLDVPAFAGSRGGTSSNPTGNSATSGQISALNLRGLGPVRTLVLFDGHRVPPSELDWFVDANTVPELLLSRVDVVTGGASAVYGSDAIGGVVNFVTDRKFVGLKLEAQAGISERGDDYTHQIGTAFGTNLFGGRGHFEASVQDLHDDGILDRNQREQFRGRYTVQGNGCPAGAAVCVPFYLAAGANATSWTYGGKIVGPASTATRTNPLLNYTFDGAGSALRPFVNGATITGVTAVQIGGDGIFDTGTSLRARQDIAQGFTRFDFDVTDAVHFYTSAAYTRDKTFNYFGDVNSNALVLSSTNAFLAPAYQTALTNAGITTFTYSKKYGVGDRIPRTNVDNTTQTLYLTAGLQGEFGGGYKWELGYTRSTVNLTTHGNFTFNNGPFFAALDAVKDPSGNIVCNVTLTNPGLYPGCVPINLFGVNSETQQAVDYVRRQGTFVTRLPLDDINGSLTGSPFDLWAGPLTLALSGEWHRQGLELSSTNPTVDYAPLNCTGLRYNCTAQSAASIGTPSFNGGVAPRPYVHMDVAEAAIEGGVPLLKDLPLVQSLSLNLAARYAKYWAVGNPDITKASLENTFTAATWKVGGDWHVSDMIRFRAARSRDIRAPNLYDLYRTNGTTFSNGTTDYLTGRTLTGAGTLPALVNGGNPQLRPEIADTLTAGVVFKPVREFSLAVDYFDVRIRNFITNLSGSDQLIQQACYNGNAFFCSLQERPGSFTDTSAANAATKYYTVPVNAAELNTKGVDVEANFSTSIGGHAFSLRGLMTYQPHVYYTAPGSSLDFAGALGTPVAYQTSAKLRMTGYVHYSVTDNLGFDWQTRFRGRMHQSPDPTLQEDASAGASALSFSNLTINYTFPSLLGGKTLFYVNVQNVFDQDAPIANSYVNATSPGLSGGFVLGDDPIGRYYRIGFRARW